jgi:hypothetical protein
MPVKNEKQARNKINSDLQTIGLVKQAIKKAKPPKCKLGEITIPVVATDIEVMFLGIILDTNMSNATALSNRLFGLKKAYGDLPEDQEERLNGYIEAANLEVEIQKEQITKIIDKHPLAKVTAIKGFTSYSLGVIMSRIKDPRRFASPSNLFVYAGVAPKNGRFVKKATINVLRKEKHEQYEPGTEPENFKEFGYDTKLQSKLYNVSESLLRAKGFFYNEYLKARIHLEQRAINNNECYKATEVDVKKSAGVMKLGEYYMSDILYPDGTVRIEKKNQSLVNWSHRNAAWRQVRTLLHIIYCEWLELLGQEARELYAIEYLGHQRKINLTEVLAWESDPLNKAVRVPKGMKEVEIADEEV